MRGADRPIAGRGNVSHMQTRIATVADVPAIALLFDAYRQFYGQRPDPDLAYRFIHDRVQNDESVILLAADEVGEIVGFCQLYPTFCSVEAKPIYVLYDLFVAPPARRLGAGRALLQAAERLAGENGKGRMELATAKSNKIAQAAYETLGWIRDEAFYHYSKHVGA